MSVDLAIGGMTCASCAVRIEKKLNRLDGVAATVNFATGTAHVDGDVPVTMLVSTVEALGYTAAPAAQPPPPVHYGLRVLVCAYLALPVLLIAMVEAWHYPGWPWTDEAAFLASILPHVYLDLSIVGSGTHVGGGRTVVGGRVPRAS